MTLRTSLLHLYHRTYWRFVRRAPSLLDAYVSKPPSPQNAIDIFAGQWWSAFPPDIPVQAGAINLFTDERITWMIQELGGVADKRVLELGPLEGGHSAMLERAGAAHITAIEANSRAYLKCLITKELLGLNRTQFLLGDFGGYLAGSSARFDLALASGVLYHMANPAALIEALAACSDTVYVWTHYYEPAAVARQESLACRFSTQPHATSHAGFAHTLWRHHYGGLLATASYCGGTETYSSWMEREELLACFRHFGFTNITIRKDDPTFATGPCIDFIARK